MTNTSNMNRNIALDILRSLACLLVIVIHSPMTSIGTPAFILASTTLLGSPCVCLFFMVSGYLLLPTKDSLFPFLQRRLSKVLFPTLFWTAFYLIQLYFQGETFEGQAWTKTLLSIPFRRQGCGFLWFMYTLIGLYILAPVLSAWLKDCSKREFQFILGLWGVSLCYPYLRPFVALTEDTYGILYYFTGYAGYFILGCYFKRFKPNYSYATIIGLYVIPLALALFARLNDIEFITKSYDYLSLMVAMMTVSLFSLVKKVTPSLDTSKQNPVWVKMVVNFSNCSFGIYLMHKFVMRDVIWSFDFISAYGGVFQIVITILLTTIFAWGISYLISWLPYADYIIGFKQKR